MRRILLLAATAATAAAACAPATTPGDNSPMSGNTAPRVMAPVFETSADIIVDPAVRTVRAPLAAPPARAWAALQSAYADAGIPVVNPDSAGMKLGNPRFVVSRRLADQPLSTFFECGRAVGGTPLADTYRITVNVSSSLLPAPGGSELRTAATASAQNLDGASRDPVVCHSTGNLETRIAQYTRARL